MESEIGFRKYDVVWIGKILGVTGSEQKGDRPGIIIQNNVGNKFSPTLIVLPLTTSIKSIAQPTHTVIHPDEWNGLSDVSMLLAEQVFTIGKEHLTKLGTIESRTLQRKIFQCFISAAACGDEDAAEIIYIRRDKKNEKPQVSLKARSACRYA